MVVYIASQLPLPLLPWMQNAPAFNVVALTEHEQPVLGHLALPHVRQAGSHTSCGCGFNEGREHPEVFDNPAVEQAGSLESSARLLCYIREHQVEQIYSCWSGDESEPKRFERRIRPDELTALDLFFREGELLFLDLTAHDRR